MNGVGLKVFSCAINAQPFEQKKNVNPVNQNTNIGVHSSAVLVDHYHSRAFITARKPDIGVSTARMPAFSGRIKGNTAAWFAGYCQETGGMLLCSSFFRRGDCYGSDSKAFQDVVDVLKDVMKKAKPVKMMIVGVADGQEPVSIMAVMSELSGHKPLKEVVDLNCLDLNPKPAIRDKLGTKPMYAATSFDEIRVEMPHHFYATDYKLKPKIMAYLKSVYKNCNPMNPNVKSHWNTDVREFAKKAESEKYDVISYNNVAKYMDSDKDRISVMENLGRMLKVDGVLITDPTFSEVLSDTWSSNPKVIPGADKFIRLKPGIWKKIQA